jgi:hypothetical protein
MNLTTLARVKAGLVGMLTSTQHDAYLKGLIISVSARIEKWLDRHTQRVARTEYLDAKMHQKAWFLKGYPVASSPAAVITYDSSRVFTGVTAEDTADYFIDLDRGRIRFDDALNIDRDIWPGSFRVAYTGGLATSLDRTTMALTGIAGTFTVGETITGATSGATGTVVSIVLTGGATGTLILTVAGGDNPFEAAEVISNAGATVSATIGSISVVPLVSAYPAIVEACNQQVAFLFQRKDSLGTTNISTEGGSIGMETPVQLTKMVKEFLAPYRRTITQ